MGLIRTLVDYGQQAYDGLKPPARSAETEQTSTPQEEVHYPQIRLSGQVQAEQKPKLPVQSYQQTLGQDTAFIQHTIRQKLAEYGVSPRGQIELLRNETGAIEIKGNLPAEAARQIEQDINRNPDFRQKYLRVSQNQPTLDYIQNNLKIRQTYGSHNTLFDSLISSDPSHNSLQDLTTRISSMNKSQATSYPETGERRHFSISV